VGEKNQIYERARAGILRREDTAIQQILGRKRDTARMTSYAVILLQAS